MNRRKFLTSSACAAATVACSEWSALAQTQNQARRISLRVDPQKTLGEIAPDFLGLGYEISSVARTGLLSAGNSAYVQYVRSLGRQGVIRIGGNTSDYSSYSKNGPPVSSPKATLVDDSVIRDLAGFLDATGWQLIWGLNLGASDMGNSIEEAQAIIDLTKDKLLAIEIGNEPDLFAGGVAHRPKGYTYSNYLGEFRAYKTALRAKFPNVPFAGPDVASHTDWVAQFASDEGAGLKLLTHHYYSEGPPQSPTSTIERLLQTDDKLVRILNQCESASRQAKVPYRICETNSCFGGGKPGVSDTFASALWGLDLLFSMATANSAGANIETGVNQLGFISCYSPIGDDEQGHYSAKPIYYGMLAFALASRGSKVVVEYDAGRLNMKAYGVKDSGGRLYVTIINKEPSVDALISMAMPWQSGRGALMRLVGPSLDSKGGVTLGGAVVSSGGTWTQTHEEHVPVRHGTCKVYLPPASAAILIAGK